MRSFKGRIEFGNQDIQVPVAGYIFTEKFNRKPKYFDETIESITDRSKPDSVEYRCEAVLELTEIPDNDICNYLDLVDVGSQVNDIAKDISPKIIRVIKYIRQWKGFKPSPWEAVECCEYEKLNKRNYLNLVK